MKTKLNNKAVAFITKYFLLFADILLIIIMGIIKPRFLSTANLLDILASASLTGIMAFGISMVLFVGELNFGAGTEATFIAAFFGFVLGRGIIGNYFIAIALAVLFACCLGLVNSFFAVKLGVPTFLATLAISTVWDAIIYLMADGRPMYYSNWPEIFKFVGQGYVGPIPMPALVFAILTFVLWFVVDKTRFGKHLQAVGNNQNCSRQAGINVTRMKVIAFILCSILCGICGIIGSSKSGTVSLTLGGSMILDAIASAMLSATFIKPGRYNVWGIVVASFLMAIIKNGCVFCGWPDAIQNIVNGSILILAVGYIASTRHEGLPSVKVG